MTVTFLAWKVINRLSLLQDTTCFVPGVQLFWQHSYSCHRFFYYVQNRFDDTCPVNGRIVNYHT